MAKGDVLNLSLSQSERENLGKLAIAFGQTRGSSPNITGFIRAIASGELKVSFADDSDGIKQKVMLKKMIAEISKKLQAIESAL